MQDTPRDNIPGGNNPITTNDEVRLENVLQRLELDDEGTDNMRTILRLMVGGDVIGWDELLTHLVQRTEFPQNNAQLVGLLDQPREGIAGHEDETQTDKKHNAQHYAGGQFHCSSLASVRAMTASSNTVMKPAHTLSSNIAA